MAYDLVSCQCHWRSLGVLPHQPHGDMASHKLVVVCSDSSSVFLQNLRCKPQTAVCVMCHSINQGVSTGVIPALMPLSLQPNLLPAVGSPCAVR
jgi:hypothetical protein